MQRFPWLISIVIVACTAILVARASLLGVSSLDWLSALLPLGFIAWFVWIHLQQRKALRDLGHAASDLPVSPASVLWLLSPSGVQRSVGVPGLTTPWIDIETTVVAAGHAGAKRQHTRLTIRGERSSPRTVHTLLLDPERYPVEELTRRINALRGPPPTTIAPLPEASIRQPRRLRPRIAFACQRCRGMVTPSEAIAGCRVCGQTLEESSQTRLGLGFSRPRFDGLFQMGRALASLTIPVLLLLIGSAVVYDHGPLTTVGLVVVGVAAILLIARIGPLLHLEWGPDAVVMVRPEECVVGRMRGAETDHESLRWSQVESVEARPARRGSRTELLVRSKDGRVRRLYLERADEARALVAAAEAWLAAGKRSTGDAHWCIVRRPDQPSERPEPPNPPFRRFRDPGRR